MSDGKFVGVCVVIGALIVAGAIFLKPSPQPEIGRYQFQASTPPGVIWRFDTVTGEVKTNP